jgi:hypothetical protein
VQQALTEDELAEARAKGAQWSVADLVEACGAVSGQLAADLR